MRLNSPDFPLKAKRAGGAFYTGRRNAVAIQRLEKHDLPCVQFSVKPIDETRSIHPFLIQRASGAARIQDDGRVIGPATVFDVETFAADAGDIAIAVEYPILARAVMAGGKDDRRAVGAGAILRLKASLRPVSTDQNKLRRLGRARKERTQRYREHCNPIAFPHDVPFPLNKMNCSNASAPGANAFAGCAERQDGRHAADAVVARSLHALSRRRQKGKNTFPLSRPPENPTHTLFYLQALFENNTYFNFELSLHYWAARINDKKRLTNPSEGGSHDLQT